MCLKCQQVSARISKQSLRTLLLLTNLAFTSRAQEYKDLVQQATTNLKEGRFGQAEELFIAALERANATVGAEDDRVRIGVWLIRARNQRGHFSAAIAVADDLRKQPILNRDPELRSQMLVEAAKGERGLGNLDRAVQDYVTAVQTAGQIGSAGDETGAEGTIGLAEIGLLKGELQAVEQRIQEATTLISRIQSPALTARALSTMADLRRIQARYAESRDLYNQVIQILRNESGVQNQSLASAEVGLAEIAVSEGKVEEAIKDLEESRKYCGLARESPVFLWTEDARGRALLAAGDLKGAAAHLTVSSAGRQAEKQYDFSSSLDSLAQLETWKQNWPEARTYLEAADEMIRRVAGVNTPARAQVLVHAAILDRVQGRAGQNDSYLSEAARIQSAYLSSESPPVAERRFEEAMVSIATKQNAKAESLLRQVLRIQEHALASGDIRTLDTKAQLGLVLVSLGRVSEAETLLSDWLARRGSPQGRPTSPKTIDVTEGLARALYSQAKYREAIPYFESVAPVLGPQRAAMAWEFLGNSRLFTNEAKLAKESYTHALALVRTAESRDVQREKSLLFVLAKSSLQAADLADADHYAKGWLLLQGTEKLQPDGYAVIVTLAKELFDSERYASAEPYLRRLLADPRSANLSSESLARVFLELAILCKQQGNLQDAVGLFQRHAELTFNRIPKEAERSLNEALKLQESIRGPRDPSLIPTLQSLALLNIHERQYERSSSLLDRSEAIIALLPAQDPILLATNLDGKGMTAKGKGDTESAASSYARAWTVLQTSASPPLKLAASILFNRGVLALEDNKVDDADQYFRKAMGLFEGAMANDAPPIEQLDVIAAFYLRKGRYEDAEKLFEKSLEVRKKIYGDRSLEYAWGLFSSANAYELRGDYSKAMNYDEKALALFTDVSGPETEEAHVVLNSLAAIYESSQKWEDAVKARERILQVNNAGKVSKQSQQEQLILLAQDYLLLRDYHQAVSARQRLVTLWEQEGLENPNYRDARRNLVPALEDAGKHEQAEQQFQTLRKLLHNRFWKDEIRLIADYANALARQKYTNEAAKLNEEAKAIQQKHSQSQ